MKARTNRIFKEARALFWPWCAVAAVGLLPLLRHRSYPGLGVPEAPHWMLEDVSFVGFFFGIPLLAALSFGNEFQHRTLPLLLSQPVRRMEIWGEKLGVMIVAVASAALIFGLGWRDEIRYERDLWLFAQVGILATIASATFWTLSARSLLGGFALNGGVNTFIPLAWFNLPEWFPNIARLLPPQFTAARWSFPFAFCFTCYAALMLWLGARKLARFEVTGGIAGEDLLMAGEGVVPGALTEWFRCRPTGADLNLIRKEVRLLQPVWLIALLAVPVWICLPLFGYTVERGSALAGLMVIGFIPLMAILAGSMSLGEERTLGTHIWHMTLPMPARRQWLIKLLVAMFAGVVCSVLLPTLVLLAGETIFRWPQMFDSHHAEMAWLLATALLSFASFWCASAVNGTVRAALWVFPVMLGLAVTASTGVWVAMEAMDFAVSRLDLFADFGFTRAVTNIHWFNPYISPLQFVLILLAPLLVVATVQSCRLYRKLLQDSPLFVVRRLGPLALTAFLWSFALAGFYSLVGHAKDQMWSLFLETHQAIEKIQPGIAKLEAEHPLQFTVDDLAKASPLSEHTRRWLSNASVTVSPFKGVAPLGVSRMTMVAPAEANSRYSATIHLAQGSSCVMGFLAGTNLGMLNGICE